MKKNIILFIILGCFNFSFGQRIIIKNANIIPINQKVILKNKSILIDNGKIIAIDDFKKLIKQKTDQVINAKNKFVLPGLADMHVHLHEENKIDTLLLYNILAGVTHIRVMRSDVNQSKLIHSISAKIKPKIHFSYTFTSKNTVNQLDSIFADVKKNNLEFIKLFSVKDEFTFLALMERANKENILVGGHFPSAVNIEKVLSSGFRSLEHIPSYTDNQNFTRIDTLIQMTKSNNVYNCPTLDFFVSAFNYNYPDKYTERFSYQFATKNQLKNWKTEIQTKKDKVGEVKFLESGRNYFSNFEKQKLVLKKLYENNCELLVGSDPSLSYQLNGFALFDEMKIWSDLGIDNYTILKSATLNAAKFFKQDENWGSIEVNKNVDLIILKKNPLENIKNITTTQYVLKENEVYNIEKMRKL